VLLNSLPALLTGLSLLWFPESPRFLLARGRPDLALRSLRRAFTANTVRSERTLSLLLTFYLWGTK
jgi:hypothetical protein